MPNPWTPRLPRAKVVPLMSRMDRRSFLAKLGRTGLGASTLASLPRWARAALATSAPAVSADLVVRNDRPEQLETTLEALGRSWITRNDRFFVRNHLSTPSIDGADWRLA